jgi:hypothetical protein
VIRLTRTIEYEYESLEDMASDLTCWTLRTGTTRAGRHDWFNFGPTKRARSRIVSVVADKPVVITEDRPITEDDPW